MAFKIERALTSLFSAFRLQSQGNLPIMLDERVQSVIDLNFHSLAALGIESINVPGGTMVVGTLGTLITTEDYLVVGADVGFFATSAAAQQGHLTVNYISPGSGTQVVIASHMTGAIFTSAGIGQQFTSTVGGFFGQPFIAKRGSQFQTSCTYRSGAAGGTVYGTLLAYRFVA